VEEKKKITLKGTVIAPARQGFQFSMDGKSFYCFDATGLNRYAEIPQGALVVMEGYWSTAVLDVFEGESISIAPE
jgi:hypothetical protein